MERQQDAVSFEQAFNRLEELVSILEQGNLPLEEATRLYEEGMRLARLCHTLLQQAEARIEELRSEYLQFLGQSEAREPGGGEE